MLDANDVADVFLALPLLQDFSFSPGLLVKEWKSNRSSQLLDLLASALLGFCESAVHARDPTIFTSWLTTFSPFRARRRLPSRI